MNAQELNELASVLDGAAYPRCVTWHAAPGINPNAVIAHMQAREKYRKRYNSKGRAIAKRKAGKRG